MAKQTSKIASLPSQRQQMETRFVELMTELFQIDEAEALDVDQLLAGATQ